MNPEIRLANELLAMMQDIKKEQLTLVKGVPLVYQYKRGEDATPLKLPSNPVEQEKLLNKLVELGAFKIEILPLGKDWQVFKDMEYIPHTVRENLLHINQQTFDRVYAELEKKSISYTPSIPATDDSKSIVEVRLVKDGASLMLVTPTEQFIISRLKTGLIPERLFSALINNRTGKLVRRTELQREVEGLTGLKDISEVIRQAGFKKQMKHLFFKHCGKDEVELRNPAQISKTELSRIVSRYRT